MTETQTDGLSLRGTHILIAEDDAILAFDLEHALRKAGAEILGPAATLAKTLALARSASVTCAVLDVNLRDAPVFPAAQALKERGAGIIFYTGYADLEGLARDWPDALVLTKPAPCGLLIQTVCGVCCSLGFGTHRAAGTACDRERQAKQEIEKLNAALNILSKPFSGHELLTRRERVVLAQIVRGASSKEAGRTLGISPRTVEFHRANIMQKLDAKNRAALVRKVLGE